MMKCIVYHLKNYKGYGIFEERISLLKNVFLFDYENCTDNDCIHNSCTFIHVVKDIKQKAR